jgi:Membrane bound O-acyl transferase family
MMKTISLAANPSSSAGEARPHSQAWIGWLPLVVLPPTVLAFQSMLVPWAFMWLLAFAIFAGCKWQTWWQLRAARTVGVLRSLGYLLLWPGMDAEQFFATRAAAPAINPREWIAPSLKTLAGALLIWSAARLVSPQHPLRAGWLAMLGIILFLHFGVFHLLSLAWRSVSVQAEPLMRQPLKSQSLGELWGRRWNLGFRRLSHTLVFGPLQTRFGVVAATLGTFLASGLIHDLAISVPAHGGYGLPTLYFLIQGCGVIAERSRTGKKLRLGRGTRGRAWTALMALGPLCLLFHPWFVLRVIVPFLHAVVR